MHVEHPSVVRLERLGWTVVKVAFVALVLMLVLNPATKGRAGFSGAGLETVLPARIKAAGLFSVNAELSGEITELTVKPGDTVTGDQLLAVISNPDIEGLVERARRRMEFAAERLNQPKKTAVQSQRRWLDEQQTAAIKNLQAAEERVGNSHWPTPSSRTSAPAATPPASILCLSSAWPRPAKPKTHNAKPTTNFAT